MIVIPDIHGRTFWKSAIEKANDGEKVVFLGDYLDHYAGEIDEVNGMVITDKAAVENFKAIIRFKQENPDRVVLLLGNHDTEYFLYTSACRKYDRYAYTISDLFTDNRELFQLGYHCQVNGRQFTFSHSCILKGWAESVTALSKCATPQEVIDTLNQMKGRELTLALDKIGHARFGSANYGSIVWADVREALDPHVEWEGDTFQVFGHTQNPYNPIIRDRFAMLDSREAFRISEDSEDTSVMKWITRI